MHLKRRNFSGMFVNGYGFNHRVKNKPGNSLALIIKQQTFQNKRKLAQLVSSEMQDILEEKSRLIEDNNRDKKKKDSGTVDMTIPPESRLEEPQKENSSTPSVSSKDRVSSVADPTFFRQQMQESEINLTILKQPPILS